MQQPTTITKLSEHFKADADNMKKNFGFEFQVVAYRKLSAGEIKQTFHLWKNKQRIKNLPKNKVVTVQALHGLDDF